MYRAIVESEPDSADAWHLLGVLALQQGDAATSVSQITRALELDDTVVDYHVNLGNALQAEGRHGDAVDAYEHALLVCEEVPETHFNLANAFSTVGKTDAALEHYQRALDLRPLYADAHNNLALLHKDQGDVTQAIVHFRKAVGADADFAPAWTNLCGVLWQQGLLEEAVDVGTVAVGIAPENAKAHYNLGQAWFASGQHDQATVCFRRATELNGNYADAYCNLGPSLLAQGDVEGAISAAEQALAQQPEMADAHWNRGFALLLSGRMKEGWEDYEWRFAVPSLGLQERVYKAPIWDGAPLVDQTLLVHAEQGFGDTIQFARYLPMLRDLAGTVSLECYPALERLMERSGLADRVCTSAMTLEFDAHIPMMSLARLFGTTLATVPDNCPYLAPAHQRRSATPPSVGIVWIGNRRLEKGRNRACSLADLAPILAVPGIDFASLQVELTEQERQVLASSGIADLGAEFSDFADTAAAIQRMDLVITIDTAVAHLAGALAAPVWTMLPFAPDWRWLLEREDSPWYPTMRLFRQPRPGDWASVVKRIAAALAAFVASDEGAEP
jgi:tetratricopeptide (TPR) repeat protein